MNDSSFPDKFKEEFQLAMSNQEMDITSQEALELQNEGEILEEKDTQFDIQEQANSNHIGNMIKLLDKNLKTPGTQQIKSKKLTNTKQPLTLQKLKFQTDRHHPWILTHQAMQKGKRTQSTSNSSHHEM